MPRKVIYVQMSLTRFGFSKYYSVSSHVVSKSLGTKTSVENSLGVIQLSLKCSVCSKLSSIKLVYFRFPPVVTLDQ